MDTAGSLKEGQIVWALADIKSKFKVFGGDEVTGYLLFTNPHQFGKTIDIRFCATRVVCNNTLVMAANENGKHSVKINHRRKFDAEQVKEILGIASHKMDKYKEQAEHLGSKKFLKSEVEHYFGEIFGFSDNPKKTISRTAEQAISMIETQPGAEFAAGTYWQLFNAATYTVDHLLGRTASSRLESATYGSGSQKKLKALKLAMEMA
jgi:phage/plasmid-like protein (TIGR03299 family)